MGFRYFAIRAARRRGVVGTVRNLADGTVEAIVEGEASAVSEFRADLARGPASGSVASVDEAEISFSGRFRSFDVVF